MTIVPRPDSEKPETLRTNVLFLKKTKTSHYEIKIHRFKIETSFPIPLTV